MSIRIMTKVWEHATDLAGSDLLVMLALADWSNEAGVCWPSVPRLAEKARVSERTARYILHRLVDKGYLQIEEHRGRKHTNKYLLNLQVLSDVKPAIAVAGLNLQPVAGFQPIKPATAIAPEPSYIDPSVEPSGGSRHKKQNQPPTQRGKTNGANKYQRQPSNRERAIAEGFQGAFGVPLEQALSGEDVGEDAPYQAGPVHKLPGPRKSA